jgi:hypothetical protein
MKPTELERWKSLAEQRLKRIEELEEGQPKWIKTTPEFWEQSKLDDKAFYWVTTFDDMVGLHTGFMINLAPNKLEIKAVRLSEQRPAPYKEE